MIFRGVRALCSPRSGSAHVYITPEIWCLSHMPASKTAQFPELLRCSHTQRKDATEAHRVGGNRKRYQKSTCVDKKSIETLFSIAICRQWGYKWQSKTLILLIFDLRSRLYWRFRLPPTRCVKALFQFSSIDPQYSMA